MQLKIIVLFLFSILTNLSLISQDYISLNNAEKIKVNILEIGSAYLVYQLWQEDGIKYRVNRSEITEVVFDKSMDIFFTNSYPSIANASTILKSKQLKNYLVGEVWIEDFWALEPYFSQNPDAVSYFFKAKKQKSTAKALGISSLVFMGGGLALASTADDFDVAFAVGVLSTVVVGPVLGTVAIINKIGSINNKDRAERAYGIRYVNHSLTQSYQDVATLNIGVSQNGLGLVLHF